MAKLSEIVSHLNDLLDQKSFDDVSLNGLQFEGSEEVTKVATSVDAALTTIEMAKDCGAQLLLTHHGLFWGKALAMTGPHKKVVQQLVESDLSLFTSHLPLDAHQEFGNNFLLAKFLGMDSLEACFDYNGNKIGCIGKNGSSLRLGAIEQRLATLSGAHIVTGVRFGPEKPDTIAICSGSAADFLYQYEEEGFDTFITGEPKQFAYHYCKERNLNAFFAGHYATETLGVMALGEHLVSKFNVEHEFLECPTGI